MTISKALTWRKDFYFDWKEAHRVIRFFERELRHVKGELAGQNLTLEKWQRRIIKRSFGWMTRENKARKFKIVWIELPRKNGKSFLASGASLYLTFGDKEPGAEVVSAAADTEQAAIVFDSARQMMDANPKLSSMGRSYKRTIVVPQTHTSYKVLSAEAYSKHGKNLHGIIVDEVHVQPSPELIDVLLTSRGSRRQPMCWMLTTAGHGRTSVCWDYHDYAIKVRDGIIEDHTFYPCIFAADPEDDWTAEETWKKANPNYGVSIRPEFLREECEKAKNSRRYENTFKRLYLNLWTEQETRWLQMERWEKAPQGVDDTTLKTLPCWGGLDLSTNLDITALTLAFPLPDNDVQLKSWFFVPQERIAERSLKDKVPYDVWEKEGYIFPTPGNVVDYEYLRRFILDRKDEYDIRELAIDPWNAIHLSTLLNGDGLTVIPFRQGYSSLSGPSKELEKLLVGGDLRHGHNPVLRWMAANVAIEQDAAGNIKPSKKKSTERIDGIVSSIMALGRLIVHNSGTERSVYDGRGILAL